MRIRDRVIITILLMGSFIAIAFAIAQGPPQPQKEDCSTYYNASKVSYNAPTVNQITSLTEMQVWYQRSIALSLIYQNCKDEEKGVPNVVNPLK